MARQPGGALARRPHRSCLGTTCPGTGGGPMTSAQLARLKVWRGLDPLAGQLETYAAPFEPGQSVLDGLRWIRANRDPTLAIRFSCINANACKECMVEIDGATVYACTERLIEREMTVKPLSNKALVRDLVTEIAPPAERFIKAWGPPCLTFPSRSRPGNTTASARSATAS